MKPGMWVYCITARQTITTRHIPADFHFENGWVLIDKQAITLKADRPDFDGYACDGCSPKRGIGHLLIGTNDGIPIAPGKPITFDAFWAHDVLYQTHTEHGLSKETVDLIFLEQLEKVGFQYAKLYYYAVKWFGGPSWRQHEQ